MNKHDPRSPASVWKLLDAKTHFSEVVRRAQSDGPQRVTVNGREAVVVVSAADYERLAAPAKRTGSVIFAAMRACPGDDLVIERSAVPALARDVEP